MRLSFYFIWLLAFVSSAALVAQNAVLSGQITDGTTKTGLGYATVALPSLSLGSIANGEGAYRIANIPPGKYVVRVSYTGYEPVERSVTFAAGAKVAEDFTLGESALAVKEVIISAQALGQQAAINQQIASNTIVNVISKEKLQELPDQNAAESLGRLSGVAVQRDAGEGQKVVIRGLSPRFASVTVNGERIPSTDGNDRSVDLSMISPDMLSGVELFKAIRPDMDGDAVGGTVNFTVKKADKGFQGDVRAFGGYNGLRERFGPWRASTTLSNRFLKNKVGLIATANVQRADRSSHNLEGAYNFAGLNPDNSADVRFSTLLLSDQVETRDRYGASLTADFTEKNHSVVFNSFFGGTDRNVVRYRRVFNPRDAVQDYSIRETQQRTTLWSNSLSGEHKVRSFVFNWRGSFSNTLQRTPDELDMRFREQSAVFPGVWDNRGPQELQQGFRNNLNNTVLWDTRQTQTDVNEYNATLQGDARYNFVASRHLNGYFKAGLKYRQQGRGRDVTQYWLQPYLALQNTPVLSNPSLFVRDGGNRALMLNFLGNYQNPNFLGGDYAILHPSTQARSVGESPEAYNAFWGTNYQRGDSLRYGGHLDMAKVRAFYDRFQGEYRLNPLFDAEDYDAREGIRAGYLMGELNVGKRMMLMGGVRVEDTRQDFTSRTATFENEEDGGTGVVYNVSAAQGYLEILPMVHVRYKFADWFDVRLAATKTLNRPDFFNLVPWERINPNQLQIDRGRPDLRHTTAWNYDAFAYFYNKYGLFTAGVFFKELQNIDVIRNSRITSGKFNGWSLTEPINLPGTSTVRGLELDFQSNLRSLRKGWNGIIVGANVTLVRSATFVPFFDVQVIPNPNPPFIPRTIVTDTVRAGRVPGQANLLANVQLGYEIKGFSGRVSWNYQDNSLLRVGTRPEFDAFTDKAIRWDVAVQQRLNRHWSAFLNLNNLSNQPEAAFIGVSNLPAEREFFGMTGEVGVRYKW